MNEYSSLAITNMTVGLPLTFKCFDISNEVKSSLERCYDINKICILFANGRNNSRS